MRKIIKKLKGEESGQALILALLMLALGGFIMAPLLTFMGSGLLAGETIEEKMNGIYAADAGIELGIQKIITDDPSLPTSVGSSIAYPIADPVNKKNVAVDVMLENNMLAFIQDLLGMKRDDEAVHAGWSILAGIISPGVYEISVTFDPPPGHENKKINGVGAWFLGHYDYVPGSASGMTDEIGAEFTERDYKGGTAFYWEFDNPGLVFHPGDAKIQRFEFTPTSKPAYYFSWFWAGSQDIGVVHEAIEFGIYKITSTAIDPDTASQTQVVAYVSSIGETAPFRIEILSWEIDPGS
ncbi:MAG: hypothetical protein KAI14_05400 [Dehalococcoidales bacterium]|nr:hypothetical protein [Dehalococcoidales bacterium]